MWNEQTDRMFLELRNDAVFIFRQDSMKLAYRNRAASELIDAEEDAAYSDLFHDAAIDNLFRMTNANGKVNALTLEHTPWFPEPAVLHAVSFEWEGKPSVALAIDRRAYGPPQEALQMMKAVLTSAYFTSLRIELQTMRASVISDKNPLMNTQAQFSSFVEYITQYAEAVIHPEDRAQFLAAFSIEQLHLFLEANTSPTCTVRRLSNEEYRWASFTLAMVNANIVLLLGKDSNEQHLLQERSDRYRSDLEEISLRNSYILSSISDIFRLMLHIDLRTGKTVLCAIHNDLKSYFSFDKVYNYSDIYEMLVKLVHPEDRKSMEEYASLNRLQQSVDEADGRLTMEYRRVAPEQGPDINARWTRSVFTFVQYEGDTPTEAIYAVQDIDAQKRHELEAKRKRDSLTNQFHTLIQNRFIWFIENDYGKQLSRCYPITHHMIMPPVECPFGQFFERVIMPNCHPEDYKRVALAMLPRAVEEAYQSGKQKIMVDFRIRSESGWRYARAEIYMQADENNTLRTMIYIADIHDEVQSREDLTNAEHEQLILRRKFGMMIEDSFRSVAEVDLDADTISHYQIKDREYTPVQDEMPFSKYCREYPEKHIYPEQIAEFNQIFSYEQILRAARSHKEQLKHLFLVDLEGNRDYRWCNICLRFFRDENGKAYVMNYFEDVNEEICKRDAQLHELKETRDQLRSNIREKERARIRKAHVFLNIASNFQLSLNQVYATLDRLEHDLAKQKNANEESIRKDFRSMYTAYEHLSAMTECAKDVLLLENNQLPLLCEPVSLSQMLWKMKQDYGQLFGEKALSLISTTTHVTQETVLCDRSRLTYIIDNIFVNIIRSLPYGSSVTLQLAQSVIPNQPDQAMYEFSLITNGDAVSQDIQSSMLSPIPEHDPLKEIEETVLMNRSGADQHNVYFSKRLIALMNGTLEFVRLPAHSTAVVLRLPFRFVPGQIIFPLRFTFGKRALVWDSNQTTAAATLEMMRETGMQLDWQPDYESVCAYLRLSVKQAQPYALLILRQSDLNRRTGSCLEELHQLVPETPMLVIADAPQKYDETTETLRLKTPLFRSALAKQLHSIFNPDA